MQEIICDLISKGKEGLWWDFKQKFHENMASMVHDILCLANVIHDGDRYIIFGISDQYQIIGLDASSKRYTQADIISHLNKLAFSENHVPTIELNYFEFQDKQIALLKVFNKPLKPYYLTEEYRYHGKVVRAGVIYSRTEDSNTPLDSCANPIDVKKMWTERFGLNLSAIDRFSLILEDSKNWIYDGINKAYYSNDSSFTIEIGDIEYTGGSYWWQTALIEEPQHYYYYLKYNNTEIHKILVVHYYNESLTIPFPDIDNITYPYANDNFGVDFYCDFFYYKIGTLSCSLYKHLREIETVKTNAKIFSTPIQSQIKPPIIKLPFFIINNDAEKHSLQRKLRIKLKEFMSNRDVIVASRFPDMSYNQHDIERLFSEWSFEEL